MSHGPREHPAPLDKDRKWPTAAMREAAARVRAARTRVIAELARIAFADITDLLDASGRPLPPGEIPPELRSVVKAYMVRREQTRVTRLGERVTTTVVKTHVELFSKTQALDALARHLGMIGPRRHTSTVAEPILVNLAPEVPVPITWAAQPDRRVVRRAA